MFRVYGLSIDLLNLGPILSYRIFLNLALELPKLELMLFLQLFYLLVFNNQRFQYSLTEPLELALQFLAPLTRLPRSSSGQASFVAVTLKRILRDWKDIYQLLWFYA